MFMLFVISKITGFKIACYIVFCFLLINKYNLKIFNINKKIILLILILILILFLNFQSSKSIDSGDVHAMSTFNLVAHSVRATNLSIFINKNDFIPAINQNIFQSIVASFFNNFSTKASIQFNFSFIMAVMPIVTFLILSLILKCAGLNKHRFISLLCMFINPSFSTHLITINDGGSSLFNSRSFDIYFSICCFLLLIYFLQNIKFLIKTSAEITCIVLISIFCSMLYAGPQFLMFISCFYFLLICFLFFKYKHIPNLNINLCAFFCLLFAGLISMTNGGFFILEGFRDLHPIPGIGGLWDDIIHAHRRIGLRTPFFLCYAEYGSHSLNHLFGNPTRILPWPQNELQYGLHKLSIIDKALYALCTLRFISVPIISIIVSYLLLKKLNFISEYRSVFYSLCLSVLVFSFFYLFIEIQCYIWPLSRLLHPILIICILSSGYFINFIFGLKSRYKILFYPIILFLTVPGVIHLSNQIQTSGLCNLSNFNHQFSQTEMISCK